MTQTTHPAPTIHALDTGDRVRSFDFPNYYPNLGVDGLDLDGERACYIEGEIVGFIGLDLSLDVDGVTFGPTQDCERYVIRVTRIVRCGETIEQPGRDFICPPINGTPGSLGGTTFGVQPMGIDLDTATSEIDDEASRYHAAEKRADALAYEIQRLTDKLHGVQAVSRLALDHALRAVDLVDGRFSDEAEDAFLDGFGCYPSEVV